MAKKETSFVYRWMEEVWNKSNESAIDDMFHVEGVVHGQPGPDKPGPEGFKEFFHAFTHQFKDVHVEVLKVISENDMEAAVCNVIATDKLSGAKVDFDGITMVRLENGKIKEAWNQFDFLTMNQQLGLTGARNAVAN